MSANRIKWLFTSGACSHVLIFTDVEKDKLVIGYCLVNSNTEFLHYAYPFYNLDYFDKNAGMGMMLHAITWAWEQNLNHIYLGTVYTKSSLYKIQFKGVEFFNGISWSDDIDKLKEIVKEPIEGHFIERFKTFDEALGN
jgi:arginyl-tRNA--protein-N-Asp/Glu arginylyltransferase